MDDETIFATAPDGRRFKAVIYESKYVPLGMCRWQLYVDIPELEWWYSIERTKHGWLWDEAQKHCLSRLQWWTEHYLEMPVAREIGARE